MIWPGLTLRAHRGATGLLAAALLLGLAGCGGGEGNGTAEGDDEPVSGSELLAQQAAELQEKTAPRPMPPPAPPVPDLTPQLIGKWEHNTRMPEDRAQVHGVTTLHPDGRLDVRATMRAGDRLIDIEASGRWTLDGEILTTLIERSSYPELLPEGLQERAHIDSVDAEELVYTDAAGRRWTERRLR